MLKNEKVSGLLKRFHHHPAMENTLELDEDHVIIDVDLYVDIKMMLNELTREASAAGRLKSAI